MMRTDLIFVLLAALSSAVNSRVFYVIPERMSWTDAQTYCRQKHTDLATIDDQVELAELLKTFSKFKEEDMWIGLYREKETSAWIWSDQSESGFRFWMSGQPNNYAGNQFCVYTAPDGSWNDYLCQKKLTFICYEMKRQIVRLEVKSIPNLILNDPEVKKEILLKIEQILKERGLTEEAKLSWKVISGDVFQRMCCQENEVSQTPCSTIRN